MKTILFQGDSITDAGRNREHDGFMCTGMGYPAYVSARLGLDNPGDFQFYNRGISGNRIVDVYARIKSDIINLKPDYMSILIGVNDVWHEFSYNNGVDTEKFVKIYSMLIEEVKEALPDIKIMIMEPFMLAGTATEDKAEAFRKVVEDKAAAAKKVAEKYSLPFMELQKDLDELAKKAPNDYWLADGVHPQITFHQYIADKWIKMFKDM